MIEQLSIGGFVYSPSGERNQSTMLKNPTEREVFARLDSVYSNNGFLSLWKGEEDEPGECSLNVSCDAGKCYVECSEVDSEGDRLIYRLYNPDKDAKNIAILGQFQNDRSLIDDIETVREICLSFLKTNGKIPSCLNVNN